MKKENGFTLMELMIVVVIIGIMASIVMPSISSFRDKQRIIDAAEAVYSQLVYARSEAISRSDNVFVNFSTNGTTTWAMGMRTTTGCNPNQTDSTQADACYLVVDDGDGTLDLATDPKVMHVLRNNNDAFPGILMGGIDDKDTATTSDDTFLNTISFFGSGAATETEFEPVRGTAENGTIGLRLGNKFEMRIIVSPIGRVRICSPAERMVGGYSTC